MRDTEFSNHGYADDNTIWKVVNPRCETSVQSGIHALEHTLEDVRAWMFSINCVLMIRKRNL